MKGNSAVFAFAISLVLMPASGFAQGLGQANATVTTNPYAQVQTPWLVAGKVKNVHGDPVRGAAVTVAPLIAAQVRTLSTDAQGQFRTEYQLNAVGVDEFRIILTVKKKGLRTAHAFASFTRGAKTWEVPVLLREPGEDPSLLSTADLIVGLAPRLKQLGPGDGLTEKTGKDYTRAVADFLDQQHPEKAVPQLTKLVQQVPSCIACRTMLALTELGWEDLDDANRSLAESVNAVLADRPHGRPEPLVAYGTWLNWQHEPDKAEPFFREALKYAPQDALTLQELGRTMVALHKFDLATDSLKNALSAGAGPEARLLFVESLVGTGRRSDATLEMNRYLDGRDVKKMPVRVRQVWASVRSLEKTESRYAKMKLHERSEQADYLEHPPAELLRGIEPAKDQAELASMLDAVGAKVQELLQNFPNTSSLEAIRQEQLGRKGNVSEKQSQKFRYLCLVPRETWGPGFVEYRADFAGNQTGLQGSPQGFMLTKGFNSTVLFFHPAYRGESKFRFLGRQQIDGRSTLVMAFAQIPEKAHLTGTFMRNQTAATTFAQGLAWFDAGNYQVIRIHTELLAPIPELQLDTESLDIVYTEVHFAHLKKALWLPSEVKVALDWNGKQLRNWHEYSEYRAFDVDASERIAQPQGLSAPAQNPEVETDQQ